MESYKLKYSEALIREGISAYWRKQIGITFPLVAVLLSAYCGYLVVAGNHSWLVGVLGTVVVIAFATMAASYFVHLSRSLKRLRRMKSPEAILELSEERFKITSDIGSSEIQWSLVRKLWRFENIWLLFFSGGEFMFIPVAELPSEIRAFIEMRLVANNAEIA
ncbi:MAG: YcxB family protein [Gammaproteobacteria bacterium]|nr:YcxB family protein [Gammaproteobacteria bacterium]